MLPFLRSDLTHFSAYTPHPGGDGGHPGAIMIYDRLDTNESPYNFPAALQQQLADIYQQQLENHRYPDGGHRALKQAIAEYVNESAAIPDITSAHISVGNGSDELIRSLLIATCLGGEGSILVADPTFSMYAILAQTLGIPVITVGRSPDNFELDLASANAALQDDPMLRVVFVVHPNSPTGNALTAAEWAWLRSLPRHILVVIDEAYFEFSQLTGVRELLQHPNWVILRTFSKAFRLAAHRVGYAIADSELVTVLEKVRLPYNLPRFFPSGSPVSPHPPPGIPGHNSRNPEGTISAHSPLEPASYPPGLAQCSQFCLSATPPGTTFSGLAVSATQSRGYLGASYWRWLADYHWQSRRKSPHLRSPE